MNEYKSLTHNQDLLYLFLLHNQRILYYILTFDLTVYRLTATDGTANYKNNILMHLQCFGRHPLGSGCNSNTLSRFLLLPVDNVLEGERCEGVSFTLVELRLELHPVTQTWQVL